jgi:general secretion pathway protein G
MWHQKWREEYNQKRKNMNKSGFSLIEIVVALFIVGIMAAIGFTAFRYFKTAKVATTKGQLATVRGAIEVYKATTNQLPTRLEDLVKKPANVKGWQGDYVGSEDELKDAWGNEFGYKLNPKGSAHPFELFSYGPEGESGSESDQVSIWEIA